MHDRPEIFNVVVDPVEVGQVVMLIVEDASVVTRELSLRHFILDVLVEQIHSQPAHTKTTREEDTRTW